MSTEKDIAQGVLTTGNFTIQAQLGASGKVLTMSGYIYSHNTEKDISAQVSKYMGVIDLQQKEAELPELMAKMEQRVRNLNDLKNAYNSLKEKQDQGKKLTSQEKTTFDGLMNQTKIVQEDIDRGIDKIAKIKVEIKKE